MKIQNQLEGRKFAVSIWIPTLFTAFIYLSSLAITLIVKRPTEPASIFLIVSFYFVSLVMLSFRKDNIDLRKRIKKLEEQAYQQKN
jgi:UDP-N-acetylmuramyl pentapeptide phosphotransferase/UDP-N-acetylglucosamine-1-phosphate transferase